MSPAGLALVFFIYGLSFFSMGLAVVLEVGRADDARLRHGLRPLAGFGFLHGLHEWVEMFGLLQLLPLSASTEVLWPSLRLGLLAFSFISLAEFGVALLSANENWRRITLAVPLVMVGGWCLGIFVLRGYFSAIDMWAVAEAWTRYTLAIPAALLASAGLVAQQRAFRQAGLIRFGQDSLWAAVAFAWYGVVGQTFARASLLPPSTFFNQELFLVWFGFPIQLVRCTAAIVASVFVIRFLRAFQVAAQRKLAALQMAQLEEAQRREALRGEFLRQVVSAQEAERTRIARELHDATGQALTALGLGLRGAATKAQPEARLRQLEELATHALDELRHIIADLRPSHLDDLGLPAALRWYANQLQERVAFSIQVEVTGAQRPLTSTAKTTLFRITQEALTNVSKHSGAQTAWVRLAYSAASVQLSVEDDGCGLTATAPRARPAWGLLGMEERAALLHGTFLAHARQPHGTRIHIEIPLDETNLEVSP